MQQIWKYLKSLVNKEAESSGSNPYIHEMIERDDDFKAAFEQWKQTREPGNLTAWIKQQFRYFNDKPEWQDKQIVFLDKPTASGFIIFPGGDIWREEILTKYFDYLKLCVAEAGYRLYMSDRRVYRKAQTDENLMEEVQRHYLKPPLAAPEQDEKQDQLYGNISIDLILHNDEVSRLQLTAHGYSDYKYLPPRPFADFIEKLVMAE